MADAKHPLLDLESMKGCAAMMRMPLYEVGSHETALSALDCVPDIASRPGTKTNTYIAWNTVSCSALVGLLLKPRRLNVSHDENLSCDVNVNDKLDRYILDPDLALKLDLVGRPQYSMLKSNNFVCDIEGNMSEKQPNTTYSTLYTDNARAAVLTVHGNKGKGRVKSVSSSTSDGEYSLINKELLESAIKEVQLNVAETCASAVHVPAGYDPAIISVPVEDSTHYCCDIVPVRSFRVTTAKTIAEQGVFPTYTTLYNSLYDRLTGTASSTSLAPVVNSPFYADTAALISLTKAVNASHENWKDVAPMVRALCLSCAACSDGYASDPVLRSFLGLIDVDESRDVTNFSSHILQLLLRLLSSLCRSMWQC